MHSRTAQTTRVLLCCFEKVVVVVVVFSNVVANDFLFWIFPLDHALAREIKKWPGCVGVGTSCVR